MSDYTAQNIDVLKGLEPVRKRPGMYTDTNRPNHLAQEVIDNSVDEALAGYATEISVTLHPDQSIEVVDNGRGMPVDIHPTEKVPGIELILERLHAGGKFSSSNYQFSGGLHGVGVSVVNALSSRLEVTIRRDGQVYDIAYENSERVTDLHVSGTCGKRNRGTRVQFWPDPGFFDTPSFSINRLKHNLKAKAVLCPGLQIRFLDLLNDDEASWCYQDGIPDYLCSCVNAWPTLPETPFTGKLTSANEALDWAVLWLPEGGDLLQESYVNLIPTAQGGTHVNGLRTGLLEALREFCDFRSLLPKGVRLTPEDLWEKCSFVLSVKMQDPQFSGQTKERLTSRNSAVFVSNIIKDRFSLWLNQHTREAEALAEHCIANAQRRLRQRRKVERKKVTQGPALPGKLADCVGQDQMQAELFLVEGDSAGGSAKQARDKYFQAILPLRGKILNTWEVDSSEVLASQEVHDIAVAIGLEPGSDDLAGLRYGKVCILADADSDGMHIATLLCALFLRHFPALVAEGHVYVAMPPLYRIDVGKEVFYALDDAEKSGIIDMIQAEKKRGKVNVQRFKGLGEMNPSQLRETTMNPDTRRLVQLGIDDAEQTRQVLDMLLARKRAPDRKAWLEAEGNLADLTG
jgi:topoisomerase-4 subunit B